MASDFEVLILIQASSLCKQIQLAVGEISTFSFFLNKNRTKIARQYSVVRLFLPVSLTPLSTVAQQRGKRIITAETARCQASWRLKVLPARSHFNLYQAADSISDNLKRQRGEGERGERGRGEGGKEPE